MATTKKASKKASKTVAKPAASKVTKAVAKKAAKKVSKKAIKKIASPTNAKASPSKAIKSPATKPKATQSKATKSIAPKTKVAKTVVTKKVSKKVSKKAASTAVTSALKAAPKPMAKAAKKVSTVTPTKRSTSTSSDALIHGISPYKEKAKETYMNAQQSEHFRSILVAWKRDLLDEVSKTIHLMQDENINHPDPNDRASQETDMSLELRSRDRERKLLKKIDATIVKLDNRDYGWCDRCGIEIGIRRLEARPTADLCVDCKTLNEIKERQMI